MRPCLALALLTLTVGPNVGMAQNPFEPDTNVSCIERLQMPAYSPLSVSEGTVTASVVLSPRATVEEVRTQLASKTEKVIGALIHSVEQAVRAGTFRSYCGGKTITLVFDFKIDGKPSGNPKQSVAFGYPNKFSIETEPAKR
jgi:hypothetical protein